MVFRSEGPRKLIQFDAPSAMLQQKKLRLVCVWGGDLPWSPRPQRSAPSRPEDTGCRFGGNHPSGNHACVDWTGRPCSLMDGCGRSRAPAGWAHLRAGQRCSLKLPSPGGPHHWLCPPGDPPVRDPAVTSLVTSLLHRAHPKTVVGGNLKSDASESTFGSAADCLTGLRQSS